MHPRHRVKLTFVPGDVAMIGNSDWCDEDNDRVWKESSVCLSAAFHGPDDHNDVPFVEEPSDEPCIVITVVRPKKLYVLTPSAMGWTTAPHIVKARKRSVNSTP
jgi:hypothetical protein